MPRLLPDPLSWAPPRGQKIKEGASPTFGRQGCGQIGTLERKARCYCGSYDLGEGSPYGGGHLSHHAARHPVEVIKAIDKLRRAYLWAGSNSVSGGKCKINWEHVCKPKEYGGLGILHLRKFAAALRLRWLWLEWNDPPRAWCGLGTPCTTSDRDLFAVLTEVKIGDGQKASFWESSWLQGVRPKDIAPKIFDISRKKGVTVATALRDGHWIAQINIDAGLTLEHLQQFLALWEKLATVAIQPGVQDSILWKSTNDGQYSAKSAYLAQFHDLPLSSLAAAVWKAWAPPNVNFSRGSLSTTEFGRLIGFRGEDGQIVTNAHSAVRCKNLQHT